MAAPKSAPQCNVDNLQTKEDFESIFKVIRIIAQDIRVVRSRKSGVIYVCKEVDCSRGQKDCDRVYAEYRLVQKTNLMKYYGLFYDAQSQQMLVIMESLRMDLSDHVSTQPQRKLSECSAKLIAMDILQKLHTLHSQHYIHCDIKPENIMFRPAKNSKSTHTANGEWILIDFGCVLRINQHTGIAHAKYRGTPSYSPPEITKCNNKQSKKKFNEYTYAVDIWALGLVILFAVIGTQPYLLSNDEYESHKNDLFDYCYHHKLMRMPSEANESNGGHVKEQDDEKETGFACLGGSKKRAHHRSKSKLRNIGQEYLQNYLVKLFYNNQISQQLFDLLHNFMLTFEPNKRLPASQLMKHQWFYVD